MSASASAAAGHGTLRPVRVLIVDDSAFARLVIARKLAADPEIEIAGYAADGAEAVEQIALLEPDVLTMDVEMPGTDGLKGLKRIMAECPTPVVMLSSLTSEGAGVTLQALDLGAVDFFMKPSASNPAGMAQAVAELQTKVKSAAHVSSDALRRLLTTARIKRRVTPPSRPKLGAPQSIVVIGASTGGPKALSALMADLPGDASVGYLIVQHMPPGFTGSLAQRLDGLSALSIREAVAGDSITQATAFLAPGGHHLSVGAGGIIRLNQEPPVNGVRPSVDVTMASAARLYGSAVIGVVLTGMGSDGTEGARAIKEQGGQVVVEHESSCTVYGMPKSVADAGYADRVAVLPRIAGAIMEMVSARAAVATGGGGR